MSFVFQLFVILKILPFIHMVPQHSAQSSFPAHYTSEFRIFWIEVIARTHSPAVNLMGGGRDVRRIDPGPTYSFMPAKCDVYILWS